MRFLSFSFIHWHRRRHRIYVSLIYQISNFLRFLRHRVFIDVLQGCLTYPSAALHNVNREIDPVGIGVAIATNSLLMKIIVDLCGYPFLFTKELNPQRKRTRTIKQYDPKVRYVKRQLSL